jgi:hypothetical protein
MTTSQNIRKGARSSRNVGPEPQNLTLVNEDLDVRASFEQVGCMVFCRKIQGFNVKLAEQFALRFNGFRAVIAGVTFQVTEETLSAATRDPSCVVKGGLKACLWMHYAMRSSSNQTV